MVIDTPKWDKITKRIVLGLIVSAVVAAIFLLLGIYIVGAASAEPLPVPKPLGPGGSCPHGYTSSGSFCVPSQGRKTRSPSRLTALARGDGSRAGASVCEAAAAVNRPSGHIGLAGRAVVNRAS